MGSKYEELQKYADFIGQLDGYRPSRIFYDDSGIEEWSNHFGFDVLRPNRVIGSTPIARFWQVPQFGVCVQGESFLTKGQRDLLFFTNRAEMSELEDLESKIFSVFNRDEFDRVDYVKLAGFWRRIFTPDRYL